MVEFFSKNNGTVVGVNPAHVAVVRALGHGGAELAMAAVHEDAQLVTVQESAADAVKILNGSLPALVNDRRDQNTDGEAAP